MKKLMILVSLFLVGFLISCNQTKTTTVNSDFSFYQENLTENPDYNANLFYLNSLDFEIADPSVIYINQGEQEGYFYAYGTSDDIRVYGFQSWRSKDMTHWESMGVALKPDFNDTWAKGNYWAPEVIYDEADQLYYLFYSAENKSTGIFELSVAYSENPEGPFVTPNNIRNADGMMLTNDQPVYDVTSDNKQLNVDLVRKNAIDISPFVDPVTKEKYIYFSYYDSFNQSEIFGLKMKDWFTPDYSTLTQLTAVGYLSVQDKIDINLDHKTPEGTINEGPFMIYHNGTYYLTYSVYGYTDEKYQVRQALSTSPLGVFQKYLPEDGGTVIATDPSWSHITSAGHHAFVYVGDEIYIAYHTFLNRLDITDGRALAVDKIEFVDRDGVELLHANGPTDSLQPLPKEISGYKNIAKDATITSNNTSEGSSVEYLNDGIMAYLSYDTIPEYIANDGITTIKLTWEDFVNARAIMIYNSVNYDDSFVNILSIKMTYLSDQTGHTETVQMSNLEYDWDYYVDQAFGQMNPGGSIAVEFDELPIKSIEITVASVPGSKLGIPEIVVLGNDNTVTPVTEFTEYQYDNPVFGSPELITSGNNIGSIEDLKTDFGYDVSHDDGTEDAYITQSWPYDQYAYFNNVYSTSFYVEAYFTVTNNHSYSGDAYPKFGLTVGTSENTIFYFVDANSTYTQDAVGVAQRKFDNSDWDWNATEQNISNLGISYKDGEYVKLAIIRDGKQFYMLVNDQLVIYYDNFNIFVENYKAAVGFLTFNTEVKIKDYVATDDLQVVNDKISQVASKVNGDVFGSSNGYKSSSGWDLSTDDGSSTSYVNNTGSGDQYLYFKDYSGSTFYAEGSISVLKSLGDPYPKFGIFIKSGANEFFYYIEANTSFNSQRVGYVQRVNGEWDWTNAKSILVSNIAYKDSLYTQLGLYRNGSTIQLFVNGTLVDTLQNMTGLTDSDCVVGFLSFTTSIQVKDYSLLLDNNAIQNKLND